MISVSSTSFCVQSIESTLEMVSKEFSHWEIFSEGEHYLPSILHRFGAVAPSYDLKYSIHAPISDVNIASTCERMREAAVLELIAIMECAIQMGVEGVTIHPGYHFPVVKDTEGKAVLQSKKSLRTLDRIAQEFGVRMALENMPSSPMMIGRSAEDLETLLEGTDMGICFDIGHANTTGQMDELLKMKDRFVNVHVHDNLGEQDDHLTMGDGNIDFKDVLSKLKGYRGHHVIESKSMESAVVSRDILKKLLD